MSDIPEQKPKRKYTKKPKTTSPVTDALITMSKQDGWTNFFTGLGGSNDKSKYTEFGTPVILDDDSLALIYSSDGLGGRIIDVVADDMTREWVSMENPLDIGDKDINVYDDGKSVLDELRLLSAEEKFNIAIKWQRLFGGAVIIVGAMDGQSPDKPLRVDSVKKIEYLKVVDRTRIPITECIFDENPRSPTFGQITQYKINYFVKDREIPMLVHASRIIPFYNDPVPSRMTNMVDYNIRHWGMSSLQRIYDEIKDLGGITQSIINILYEFIIGKYKIQHLADMLAAGQESKIVKRIEIMNRSKSVLNAVLLGEEEEYTRDYATLAGLPEVIDRFMLKLSGSTGIPVTRLFGRSPAGLNATGENDLRNYYDLIEAAQRNKLLTPITVLVNIISSYKKIKTVPTVIFNSLYQLSEEEASKVLYNKALSKKAVADADSIYVSMGARDPLEISKEHGWTAPEQEDFNDPDEMEKEEVGKNGKQQK